MNTILSYIAPQITVENIKVEAGFATSGFGSDGAAGDNMNENSWDI